MRLVDVNEFYTPLGGGVRSYIDRKIGLMAELGHEQIVIAPGREDWVDERPGGGRIIYVKAPRMPFDARYGLFWSAEPVTRLLDELDPDVVECSSPWRPAWIVGEWEAKGPKRALKAFFMHNDNVEAYPLRWFEGLASPGRIERAFAWYTRYMGRFLSLYDTVVTNGEALKSRLEKRGLHIDAAMTLGIEREFFSPDKRDPALRRTLLEQCGLPEDAHLLVAIGRHHPEKRWPTVIDAVERAGARLPVGLAMIGEGMISAKLERRIAGSPHIRLFRPITDRRQLARVLASCDGFIHGNDTEPFGLVVSEALASGAPLVVPSEGGAAAVARPEYAETFAPRDARSAAAAIERLFTRDQPILRRAAAVAAGRVVSDREHAARLAAYYAELIKGRAARQRAA